MTFISCLSGHHWGATGFNLLRTCQSAFLSWPSYSGMFIQVYACLPVVCSEQHRVTGRANRIYVTQLFNTKPEVRVNHCGASETSSLKRCRISETTRWLIHHFGFAWHILWKKKIVFFSPWKGEKLQHFVLHQNALLYWLFLGSLRWSENSFEFHRLSSCSVSNCSSELGPCVLMKCLPLAFAMWLLGLLFAAVHIDPK